MGNSVLQLLTAFGGPCFFDKSKNEAYSEDNAEQLIVQQLNF